IGALFSPRSGPCNPDRTAPGKETQVRCGSPLTWSNRPSRAAGTAAPPPTAARRRLRLHLHPPPLRLLAGHLLTPAPASAPVSAAWPPRGRPGPRAACSTRRLIASASDKPNRGDPPPIRYPTVIELKFSPKSTAGGCNQSSALPGSLCWALLRAELRRLGICS
uniref:Uncharacterized protein n=1 Tax=Oryza meridionalis TaxID=40149 RepID=A0A0E0BY52_9ORYZ